MIHAPTRTIARERALTAEVSDVMECNTVHPWLSTQLLDGSLDDACTFSHLVERQKGQPPPISFDRIDGSVCVRDCRSGCVCGSRE